MTWERAALRSMQATAMIPSKTTAPRPLSTAEKATMLSAAPIEVTSRSTAVTITIPFQMWARTQLSEAATVMITFGTKTAVPTLFSTVATATILSIHGTIKEILCSEARAMIPSIPAAQTIISTAAKVTTYSAAAALNRRLRRAQATITFQIRARILRSIQAPVMI